MKKIQEQIKQSKLLAGKVLGDLSEEQKEALYKWETDLQNKKIEDDILNAEAFNDWNNKLDRFDSSDSWEHFVNKMQKSNTKGKLINLPILKRVVSIAASVILLVSLGLVFFFNDIKQTEELASVSEIVEPGEFKATLILSTGEIVRLSDINNDSITDMGLAIQHDADAGINYSKDALSKKAKQSVVYNTLKVARGEEYKVVLADGTHVWLNADSELRYPVQFFGKQRSVYLKGEAYFDVTHNKNKAFVVHSHDQQVKVYGTEFCIDAYNKEEIKTVLVEGSVGVKANKYEVELKLKPGELGTVNAFTGDTKVEKVNVRPYIAWKDSDFVFEHERLESIMMKLERWYNVKIFYMNEECKDFRFTGDVERYAEVHNLLKFIKLTSKAKFEVKNNTIVVMTK